MLLAHPMMVEVLASMFSKAQSDLMQAKPGDLTAMQAHARMLALKDIRDGFESFVNEEKIAAALAERKVGAA